MQQACPWTTFLLRPKRPAHPPRPRPPPSRPALPSRPAAAGPRASPSQYDARVRQRRSRRCATAPMRCEEPRARGTACHAWRRPMICGLSGLAVALRPVVGRPRASLEAAPDAQRETARTGGPSAHGISRSAREQLDHNGEHDEARDHAREVDALCEHVALVVHDPSTRVVGDTNEVYPRRRSMSPSKG